MSASSFVSSITTPKRFLESADIVIEGLRFFSARTCAPSSDFTLSKVRSIPRRNPVFFKRTTAFGVLVRTASPTSDALEGAMRLHLRIAPGLRPR